MSVYNTKYLTLNFDALHHRTSYRNQLKELDVLTILDQLSYQERVSASTYFLRENLECLLITLNHLIPFDYAANVAD